MTIVVQVSSTATSNTYSPDILNWVCPDVPMAPLPLVTNAIRDSVIELCERALIWRQELQQILVLAPTATTTTAAAAAQATTLALSDTTGFTDGSTITVALSDGTRWRGHQTGDPSGGVITLDGALNLDVLSGADLGQFKRWYSQAGTPEGAVSEAYDPARKTYALTLTQSCPPPPGQASSAKL